jgi:hypothetical protein
MSDFEDRLRGDLHHLAAGAEPPPTLAQNVDSRLGAGPAGPAGPRGLSMALLGVAAAIVITAVALILVAGNKGGKRVVLTQGTSTTTTSDVSLGLTPGDPGTDPPPSDTTTAEPATTLTAPGTTVTPTTIGPAVTNPTSLPTSTSASTTTSTTVALAECPTSGLRSATSTDQPQYQAGSKVTITVTVTNVSGHPCQITNPYPSAFTEPVKITLGGAVIWQPASTINGIVPILPPKTLDPGQSYTWATVQWSQDICATKCAEDGSPKPPAPRGPYLATAPAAPPGSPAMFTLQ